MKFGTRDNSQGGFIKSVLSKPVFNRNKIVMIIVITTLCFAGAMIFTAAMWLNLQREEEVVVAKVQIHKNELITEDMLKPYKMIKAEFERYSYSQKNGIISNRLVKWADRKKILGYFSAYTIRPDSHIEYKNLIGSVQDNTNAVMYQNPGKELIKLNIAASEINAYKDMLMPGDKINVMATYQDSLSTLVSGRSTARDMNVDVIKTDTVFSGLVVADIRNAQNKSVLDYLIKYKELSAIEQANIAATDEYAKATAGETLLVCLTSSEINRLKLYESLNGVKFFISLPQKDS